MTREQKAAFEKLLKAKDAYIEAHASEVYQGGTMRNIRTNGSQEILEDLFETELVRFERKEWPRVSDEQIRTADASLDREYAKTLERTRFRTKEDIEDGVVTAAGVSSAEKSWEAYRDAWVGFARVRHPSAAGAIEAKITVDRSRLLKTIS